MHQVLNINNEAGPETETDTGTEKGKCWHHPKKSFLKKKSLKTIPILWS